MSGAPSGRPSGPRGPAPRRGRLPPAGAGPRAVRSAPDIRRRWSGGRGRCPGPASGLIDDEQVPRPQPRPLPRPGIAATSYWVVLAGREPGPGTLVVPAPTVLERQPRRRPGSGADFGGGDLGRLQGWG